MINPFQQAQQYQGQAAGVFGQMTGFNAPQYRAPTTTDINQYMNPYTQNVIDRTQQDITRQQQMAQNQLGAQATSAGAFGGSRHGVAEGVMAGEYGRMAGDFAARQREQAYNFAQQQAQLAQQEQYNRALGQIGIRQQGATGLRGLGQEQFARGQYGIQQQQAAAQQQMQQQQQLLDAARLQTLANLGYPQQSLTFGSGVLGNLPRASVTEQGGNGLFGTLAGIAQGIGAIARPFGMV